MLLCWEKCVFVYTSAEWNCKKEKKIQTTPFCASTLFARQSLLDRNECGNPKPNPYKKVANIKS